MKGERISKLLMFWVATLGIAVVSIAQAPEKPEKKNEVSQVSNPARQAPADKEEASEEPGLPDLDAARLPLAVAKIDGKPVSLGYVEAIASVQNPMVVKDLLDEKGRLDFVKKIINMELMAAEAKRRGFDKDVEVDAVKKNQLASSMHRRISASAKEEKPTEEDLRKYYDEHYDDYNKPPKVRVRHILIADKGKAQELLKQIVDKETDQREFRKLVQESTEDEATKFRGGDLGFITMTKDRREGDTEIDPALAEAAFKIEENGKVYPKLVETAKGFHILMRTGSRDKMNLSFEDARDRLELIVKRDQRRKKIEDAIEELKNRFKVEVFEENLKYVVIDLSDGPPEPGAKGGLTKKERRHRKRLSEAATRPVVLQKSAE